MRSLLLVLVLCISVVSYGQELLCTVTINSSQVQTTDRNVFKDMKNGIEQFMNGRKWSSESFKNYEKINCNILITITKMPSIGSFEASVQIRSARPVFGTNYSSLLLNFADRDWEFEYIESQPLEYNDNNYTTNLTSMLAYYAYVIIGLDFDSFSELGGTPYFQKALAVVNNAQQGNRTGWQPLGSNRNRYSLLSDINNPQMADVRKAIYSYHRLAMDTYEKSPDQSRDTILKGLKDIKKVRDINPSSILVISFFDAKAKELVNIFSSGNIQVRRQAYDLVSAMDPSNRLYDKMIQN
jgi:hypothetical protein